MQAAKLIDALKDSPLIRDAGFQGSIQPDPTTGKERFYMVAQGARAGAPASREDATAPARAGSTP